MEETRRVMYCNNGDCVDVSRVICEDKFSDIDEIIECEALQSMTKNIVVL